MDRRDFFKITGGTILLAASGSYSFRFITDSLIKSSSTGSPMHGRKWGMLVDITKCIDGCTECLIACRQENNVAFHGDERWDIHWIRKVTLESTAGTKKIEKDVLLLCNHCENPPCAQVCPVQATYKRDDGIVIVDHHRCIGCRYCMIACPYNARSFNFKDHHEWDNTEQPKRSHGVAEACNLCAHRLDVGQKPACVEACSRTGTNALISGDLNDETGELVNIISTTAVKRIREDLGTDPKVYYIGL